MTRPFAGMSPEEARIFMATKTDQRVRGVISELVGSRSVIDIGCGKGVRVASLYSPQQYYGVDCSEELVKLARLANPGYEFAVCDVRTETPEGHWDCAVVKSVLEHTESLEDALTIYEKALELADEVLVAWHTPPHFKRTEIIRVQAELREPIFQNHYVEGSFDRDEVQVERKRVDEFELWVARRH